MSTSTVPGRHNGHHHARPLAGTNTVNTQLTPNGTRPVVENDEYAAFARRILRAYARRIATGDIESLILMTNLAGLSGGKGIPETVATHPCVFATLTAPSFGPVHARRIRGKTVLPCRPRRDANAAAARTAATSPVPAATVTTIPGSDARSAATATTTPPPSCSTSTPPTCGGGSPPTCPRHFARLAGLSVTELRRALAIRYVKVAEYQARGVVHFHTIIRLDAPGDTCQTPSPAFTATMLCDAVAQAANSAAITTGPSSGHPARTLRFGRQTDARPVRHGGDLPGTGCALGVQAVANYIAKYATKALDAPGIPDRPIRSALDLENLRCSRHYTQMITTAWQLGGGTTRSRFCKWAHMLGYGGHFLTKSRRYSVTFGQLRRARTVYRRQQRHPHGEYDPWGRPLDDTVVLILSTWTYAGTGYTATRRISPSRHDQPAWRNHCP